jgi:hypothetical protein
MSDNSINAPSNAITMTILIAFVISTAIFSCLATLLVTWIILYRRRRRRRSKALLRAKQRQRPKQKPTSNPYLETPPMKTSPKFPSSVLVSPLQHQHSFIYTNGTPLSSSSSESAGPVETPRLIHEADGSSSPIEMMGSTTWSKWKQ